MNLCSYCHTFMEGAPLRKKTCSVKCRKALSRSKPIESLAETPEILKEVAQIPSSITNLPSWMPKDIFKPKEEPKEEKVEEVEEVKYIADL